MNHTAAIKAFADSDKLNAAETAYLLKVMQERMDRRSTIAELKPLYTLRRQE